MNRRPLIEYLKDPSLIAELTAEDLKKWIAEAPYSQSLRRMLAMKTDRDDFEYDDVRTDAALYSPDRTRLKEFLEGSSIEGQSTSGEIARISEDVNDIGNEDVSIDKAPMEKEVSMDADEEIVKEVHDSGDDPSEWKDGVVAGLKEIDVDREESDAGMKVDTEEGFIHVPVESEEIPLTEPLVDDPGQVDDEVANEKLTSFSKWLLTKKSLPQVKSQEKSHGLTDSYFVEWRKTGEVSPTLAELLIQQGHIEEAVKVYEKLILKYPEKSDYFAAQIAKLNSR